jgi:ATP-dependent exoDNAse (exonuclease V) beta subunit
MCRATVCEREIYVGAPGEVDSEAVTIWGYVDAVFQTDDGSYAVIDFKTDAAPGGADELRERYRAQLLAYAEVIEHATGTVVSECWLLAARADAPAWEVAIDRR